MTTTHAGDRTYRGTAASRTMSLAGILALLAIVFLVRVGILENLDGPLPAWLDAVTGLCVLVSLHRLVRVQRGGFVLASDAVVQRGAWRTRRLPTSAIEGCRIRHVPAKGAHVVELRSSSAGAMTLWFEDEEIREAAATAWLAMLPGRQSGAIAPAPGPRPPFAAALVALFVVPALAVAAGALWFFAHGLRPALEPAPGVAQLTRTQGVLARAGVCREARGDPPFDVVIATSSGDEQPDLHCRYGSIWLHFRVGHRIAVLSGGLPDEPSEIWAVEIDGQPLVTYAEHRARRIDMRGSALAFQLLLALSALAFVAGLLRTFRELDRPPAGA